MQQAVKRVGESVAQSKLSKAKGKVKHDRMDGWPLHNASLPYV